MKPLLLFDADGVIINAKMFSQHLADKFGISTETTKTFFAEVFPDCIEGKADVKEAVLPFLKAWGWKQSVDDFFTEWFRSSENVDTQLITAIQEIRMKGITCYVATNQEQYRTEYMKETMQFNTLFDGVFSSAALGYKKPKREFYAKIAEALEVTSPHTVWFFDDTQENVLAAEQFGFRARLYTQFEEFQRVAKQEGWL